MRFTFDEPTNFDERIDWWRLMTPLYGPGWRNIVSFHPRIGIAQFCGVIPSYVNPTPLTVEADGNGIAWHEVGTVLLWPSVYSWSPLVSQFYRQDWTLDKRKACTVDACCEVTL